MMDWSILIGASQLAAGLGALWLLSFVLLLVVRFALCAEKWEGFITLKEWYLKTSVVFAEDPDIQYLHDLDEALLDQYPHSVKLGSNRFVATAQKIGDKWYAKGLLLHTNFYSKEEVVLDIQANNYWFSTATDRSYNTLQECLDAIKGHWSYQESKVRCINEHEGECTTVPYIVLTLPALVVAALADLFLYAFFLSPVLTLSVSGIVLTIACSRFLSSKLADNIKQTKENTDDIKSIKDTKSSEENES